MFQTEDEQGDMKECLVDAKVEWTESDGGREEKIVETQGSLQLHRASLALLMC